MVLKMLLFYAGLFFCLNATAQAPLAGTQPNGFVFTLPHAGAVTSAGVYSSGVLIRTIWSNVPYSAGSHTGYWDGKDDLGNAVAPGTYQIKVLANNINYAWEGTIGNNSTNQSGPTKWASYGGTLSDMVNVGSYMYCTMWFSEYTSGQMKFNTSTPNQCIKFSNVRIGQGSLFTCANANYVFYGGRSYTFSHNYVFATKVSNDANATFTSGVIENPKPAPGTIYNSVLDLNTSGLTGAVTGMAVQQSGSQYLYVAHAAQNVINVYRTSEGTGSFIRTISITGPTNLAFEGDGTLWIAQGTTVTKYTVNNDGTITAAGPQLTGFSRVAGLDILSADMCVLDAGNQQVVKRYNTTSLSLTGTIGQLGGYATSPTVADNKFYEEDVNGIFYTFVRHQSDGSIWVCDPGNCRYQHFNSRGIYLNNIMFLQQQYNVNVCLNQPTQVFSDYLEYTIDYTKPLSSGWTLTNNWGYNRPVALNPTLPINGVILMSNGRRYGVFKSRTNFYYMGELTSGGVRYNTLATLPANPRLDSLGNLYVNNTGGTYPYQSTVYQKYTLTGFDGSNNPTYSFASIIATVPLGANSGFPNTGTYAITASGNIILFNSTIITHGGGANRWFHLSGYNVASNTMVWKTSPETFKTYNGILPTDGAYDTGNGVVNAGSDYRTIGNNIFYAYRGEGWRGQFETGIFNHFNQDGLFLGQFGVLGVAVAKQVAPAGYAGNVLNIAPVAVGNTIYFYNNDEEHNSGLHRWKITNLGSIYEQTINLTLSSRTFTPATNTVDLLSPYPNGWSQNYADYNNSSTDFLKTIIGTENYTIGSPPSLIFNAFATGVGKIYTKVCALPSFEAANLNITGVLDLSQGAFHSSKSGSQKFYIDVLDNAHKVICRLIGYTDLTFQFNGVSYGPFGPLLVSTIGYGDSPFVIKKSGSKVSLSIFLFGTWIPAIPEPLFDPTANINAAAYISFNWAFTNTATQAQFGIKSLIAVK
jgi:hypothetical protein